MSENFDKKNNNPKTLQTDILNKGLKLLCDICCDHDQRETFQVGNSSGGKNNTSGHHLMSGDCNTGSYVMTW